MENPNYGAPWKRIDDNGIAVGSPTVILNILRVSKQIRREALPIFYAHNSFHLDSLSLLIRALQGITEETAQQMQDLRISMECGRPDLQENALQELNRSIFELSPKKLILIARRNDFWWFCDGVGYESEFETPSAPAGVHKLDSGNGLGKLVTLAKSVDHLRIFGDGFLRARLEERTKKAEMGQTGEAGSSAATVGTVNIAQRQLAKAIVTENA